MKVWKKILWVAFLLIGNSYQGVLFAQITSGETYSVPPNLLSGRLDSTWTFRKSYHDGKWWLFRKSIKTYPRPNVRVSYRYEWGGRSVGFKPVSRETSFHDRKKHVAIDTTSEWNEAELAWEFVSAKYERKDSLSETIERLSSQWESGRWYPKEQFFIRLISENVAEYVNQKWNRDLSNWENTSKEVITRNGHGNIIKKVFQEWNPDQQEWVPVKRYTYQLEANGKPIEVIKEEFDSQAKSWEKISLRDMTYNSKGKMEFSEIFSWNDSTRSWENHLKYRLEYNDKGGEIFSVGYEWNPKASTWGLPSYGKTNWDNIFNKRTEIIDLQPKDSWKGDSRWTITYNIHGQTVEFSMFTKKTTEEKWSHNQRRIFFRSKTGATSSQLDCTFPNPLRIGAVYSCMELNPSTMYILEIHDLQGRTLQKTQFMGAESFKLNGNFSEGVYLFSISDGQEWVYRNKVRIK
ncbi:MAG: hypothetical protein AAGI38_13045 [Bacteroidota bacterium]